MSEKEAIDPMLGLHLQQRNFFIERLSSLEVFTYAGMAAVFAGYYNVLPKYAIAPSCLLGHRTIEFSYSYFSCLYSAAFNTNPNIIITLTAVFLSFLLMMAMYIRGSVYLDQIKYHENWIRSNSKLFTIPDPSKFARMVLWQVNFVEAHKWLIRSAIVWLLLIYVLAFYQLYVISHVTIPLLARYLQTL